MGNLRGSRFQSTGVRSLRRKTNWAIGPQTAGDGASIAIGSSQALLAANGAQVIESGITLVRLRGSLNLFLTSAAALGDGFHGAFGIGIATLPAFTIGVTAVPTPITEESWNGWLYHRYFGIFSGGPIAAATAAQEALQVNSTSAALNFEVDSKAMRKLNTDTVIFAALEVIELGASSTMEFAFNSRLLVKLP